MKIVVNKCFGGFSISRACAEYMEKLGDKQAKAELKEWRKEQKWLEAFKKTGIWPDDVPEDSKGILEITAKYKDEATFHGYGYCKGFDGGYKRESETLVKAVEKLQSEASGQYSRLEIVEIPDDVEWFIDEYDGMESIHEQHRSW